MDRLWVCAAFQAASVDPMSCRPRQMLKRAALSRHKALEA